MHRIIRLDRKIQILMSEVEICDRGVPLMLVFRWESILVELDFDVLGGVFTTEVLLVLGFAS